VGLPISETGDTGERGVPNEGESERGLKGFVSSQQTVSKSVVEKLGNPHEQQYQETFVSPSYTAEFMPIHFLWYHPSHESQHTPGVVHLTALLQI
jgi:hypothetical protein